MRRSIRFPAMLCSAILLFGTDRYAHAEKVVEIVNVNCGGHQWEPESTMTGRANPKDRGAAPVAGTGCFTPDCYYDGNRVFVFYTGLNSSHPKGVPQSSPDLQPEHIMVAVSDRPDGGFVKTRVRTPLSAQTRGLQPDEATIPGGNVMLRGKPTYDVSLIDHGQWWMEVEVTSVAANRIRALEQSGREWKIMRNINIVSQNYRPFEPSKWPVEECGLLGPVRMVPMK